MTFVCLLLWWRWWADGGPSDSGWELRSVCGSVAVSGVFVVTDMSEFALSVVSVMCEGVPLDSEWDFVELLSFFFSRKRQFACVEKPGRHALQRNSGKGSFLP